MKIIIFIGIVIACAIGLKFLKKLLHLVVLFGSAIGVFFWLCHIGVIK